MEAANEGLPKPVFTPAPLCPHGPGALSLQLLIWRPLCPNMGLREERYCLLWCHQSAPPRQGGRPCSVVWFRFRFGAWEVFFYWHLWVWEPTWDLWTSSLCFVPSPKCIPVHNIISPKRPKLMNVPRVSLDVQSAPRRPHLSREVRPDDTTGVPFNINHSAILCLGPRMRVWVEL